MYKSILSWTICKWILMKQSWSPCQTCHYETAKLTWHYPVPQATSSTLRTPCCFSRDTTQLLYSCVLLFVSPMYSCHTFAALPSAYWSGRPTAATPRDRVLNTLSTDILPLLLPARTSTSTLVSSGQTTLDNFNWVRKRATSLVCLPHASRNVIIYMNNLRRNFKPMTRRRGLPPTFWLDNLKGPAPFLFSIGIRHSSEALLGC